MYCRNRGRGRDNKSQDTAKTVSSSDQRDPVEPSTSLLEQPGHQSDQPAQQTAVETAQPARTPVAVGTGKVISPEDLRKELAVISTRDDAHRLISSPPPSARSAGSGVTIIFGPPAKNSDRSGTVK